MREPYPPLPNEQLQNCEAITCEIDRVVLTNTGIYVRTPGGWIELKNLLEARRPPIAINALMQR